LLKNALISFKKVKFYRKKNLNDSSKKSSAQGFLNQILAHRLMQLLTNQVHSTLTVK